METDAERGELNIHLLGPFRIEVAGREVPMDHWNSKKALTLVKYLLAKRGKKVSKDVLVEVLWPESDEAGDLLRHRLHTTIYLARKQMKEALGPYEAALRIRYQNGLYWLESDHRCWVDTDRVEFLYGRAVQLERDDPAGAYNCLDEALRLCVEDGFLPEESYCDWTDEPRGHFIELYINMALKASHLLMGLHRDAAGAVALCRKALAKDPYREELHRTIMLHLIESGQYGEAANEYRRCADMLEREFGLLPSPATQTLLDRMNSTLLDGNDEKGRNGATTALMTVFANVNGYTDEQKELILNLIAQTLRKGDVVSREEPGRIRIQIPYSGGTRGHVIRRRLEQALRNAGRLHTSVEFSVLEPRETYRPG